jgi:hypothetical protein
MDETMPTRLTYTVNLDRRSGRDRRKTRQAPVRYQIGCGRRRSVRRRLDRAVLVYPDRYSSVLFGLIFSILLLSVLDAYLTLFLIGHGADEVNPLMAFYLEIGPRTFMLVKYGLTSSSVLVLLLLSNVLLPDVKPSMASVFTIIFAVFASVIVWQLYLVMRHVL